jgi:putative transposase
MYLPGVPAHVVQRGNNREACFFQDEDYQFYLAVLGDEIKRGQIYFPDLR